MLALYDYIANAQKQITSGKLNPDLNDVNKKVTEIEGMLHSGLASRKYSALMNFSRRQSGKEDSFITSGGNSFYNKRSGLKEKVKEALEAKTPSYSNKDGDGNVTFK